VPKPRKYNFDIHGRIPGYTTEHATVASDAGVNGARVGLGWLSDTGHWGASGHRYPTEFSGIDAVTIAELRAVAHAWRHIQPSGPVTLLLDSQAALSYLRRWLKGEQVLPPSYQVAYRADGEAPSLVGLAEALAGRTNVTVRWVEGHTGHGLNEGADSLAKLALRGDLARSEAMAACRVIAGNRVSDLRREATNA
jgi:ribonuclease HI